MSKSNSVLPKWIFSSIGSDLSVRQNLAKFIFDLGTKLKVYVIHFIILFYLKIKSLDLMNVSIQLLFICIGF